MRKSKEKKVNKYIYWIPRIWSIVFILFLMLFSLDVFGQGYGFWGTTVAFLMHNLPAFILTAVLIIGWRSGLVPGILFIAGGLLYIGLILRAILMEVPHQWFMLSWTVMISGPAFTIGILFLIGWYQKK